MNNLSLLIFMKPLFSSLLLSLFFQASLFAKEEEKHLINLTPQAAKNLGIEVRASQEVDFERTLFSIGNLESIPSSHSVVSSRIAGRVIDLRFIAGDRVSKGDLVARVESLQTGPHPTVVDLFAPSSGVVAESHIQLGAPITPENELLDIIDLSKVWAIAQIPQQEASQVKIGTKARLHIPALGDQPIMGELIRYGTHDDPRAATFEAIFLVDNAQGVLRPGMRCEFSIITSLRKGVTVVPKEAIQGSLGERFVYVRDFDLKNSYMKIPVALGEENDTYAEVTSGLFPGDEVVTKGAYLLSFAGGGNMSLKEALDAAHGHEHNADGSEITPEQQKAQHEKESAAQGGVQSQAPLNVFLLYLCTGLFFLLILAGVKLSKSTNRS